MSMVYKPVGGAIIGVTVPIGIEYAAKGGRLGATEAEPNKGFKISGVVGVGLGIVELLAAWAGYKKRFAALSKDEDVAMMASMGGASLATGGSILILDELRKRAAYTFKRKRGTNLPIRGEGETGLEREEFPTEELVEEV